MSAEGLSVDFTITESGRKILKINNLAKFFIRGGHGEKSDGRFTPISVPRRLYAQGPSAGGGLSEVTGP